MSIFTARDNYSSKEEFQRRSNKINEGDNHFLIRDQYPYSGLNELNWLRHDSKGNVLDFGCGYGRVSKELVNAKSYTGVDIIPDRIEYARKTYGTYGDFYLFDEFKEKCKNKKFDVIICVFVLQHLNVMECKDLFEEVFFEHLLVGGKILAVDELLLDKSVEECEALYKTRPEHMIPKPVSFLLERVPFRYQHLIGHSHLFVKQSNLKKRI